MQQEVELSVQPLDDTESDLGGDDASAHLQDDVMRRLQCPLSSQGAVQESSPSSAAHASNTAS
jgi:hypothetical protein